MMKIFLDDIRIPLDETWVILTNYQTFIDRVGEINFNDIEIISLDHDLGDINNIEGEKTGYDIAKWLVDQSIIRKQKLPLIKVHSANPVGSKNIIDYINNYLRNQNMCETTTSWIVSLKRGVKL